MSDLSVFYVLDLSESMKGKKLDILNHTVEECNETLLELANEKNAELKVAMMTFSDGCDWITPHGPEPIEDFAFNYFQNTSGLSNLGIALYELNKNITDINFYNISSKDYLPIIIIITDKDNIDNYENILKFVKTNNIYENSIKIAYTIGNNHNTELISYITDNKNSIITNSNENFRKIIKIFGKTTSQNNKEI
ncbi:MAG: hypothetical protein J6Z11_12825, partial [Candidatus Riflebacteria bacterium]|nr:hypothetical protein [Candidatus Riflebacteria bacterium]